MKKLALILAMLLLAMPLLTACGGASSPEAAVETALDVMFGDGDANVDDYYEVALLCNTDILELIENGDKKDSFKESARATQKAMKDSLNLLKDADKEADDEGYDDWSFSYEIAYCDVYKEKDNRHFDDLIESFPYADTDIEEETTAIAKVGVILTTEFEKDGETYTSVDTQTFTVYEIDGNWYIG